MKKDYKPMREDSLEEFEDLNGIEVKQALARQIIGAMKERKLTKSEMAALMHTSRSQLERLFDPENTAIMLETIQRAASVVGKELRIELVERENRSPT
jgi:antitoxin HicB